jgi:hypothetical protein
MTSAITMRSVLQLSSAWQSFLGLKPASPNYRQQLSAERQQSMAPMVDAVVAKLEPLLRQRTDEMTATLRRALLELRISEPVQRSPSYPFVRSPSSTGMQASLSGEALAPGATEGGAFPPVGGEQFMSASGRRQLSSAFQLSRSGRGTGAPRLDSSTGSWRLREAPEDALVVEWAKTALKICRPYCPLCFVLTPQGPDKKHECTPTKCPQAIDHNCCCHCFLTEHHTSHCPSSKAVSAAAGQSGPRCTSCTLGHEERDYLHLCAGALEGKRCTSLAKRVVLPLAWALYHHATAQLSSLLQEADLVGDWARLAPLQPDAQTHRELFLRWLLRPVTQSATVSNAMMLCIWWTFTNNANVANRTESIQDLLRQASKW